MMFRSNDSTWCHQNGGVYSTSPGSSSTTCARSSARANRGKRAKDFTPLTPLQEVPEGTPTKLMFGSTAVVVIRRGDVVHTLKETCSHAAGPLSAGELKDDTITCPWHGSTFRLPDGSVVHGPAHSRQPSYHARVNAGMIELQGPHD